MPTESSEFRIILSPADPVPASGATSAPREWSVNLDVCPNPLEVGNKGVTTSKLPAADLEKLRSPAFHADSNFLHDLGHKVWESIMTAELSASLNACYNQQVPSHAMLPIVVVFKSPDQADRPAGDMAALSDLPLELLRRPENAPLPLYVTTDTTTPISRALEVRATVSPLDIAGPLRILAVVSAPADFPPADTAKEKLAIQNALKPAVDRGQAVLEFCEPPTLEELNNRLRSGTWHVFHFAGHGGVEPDENNLPQAYLAFLDPAGADGPDPQSHKVRAENLGINLNDARELRLVVLTACAGAQQPGAPAPQGPTRSSKRGFDSVAAHLLKNTKVGAVIAMQFDLESQAAEILSGAIYGGLLAGERLDLVLNRARKKVISHARFGEGHRAWANPTLLWRCRDGLVFRSMCGLDPTAMRALGDLGPQLDSRRTILLELYGQLQTSPAESRTYLMPFLKNWQQKLSETLNRQSELLGESLRLVPVSVQLGKPARCSVIARPRNDVAVSSLKLKVRLPADTLRFVKCDPGTGLPGTVSLNGTMSGEDLLILYFDGAGTPQPWRAGQETELCQIAFNVLDGRPTGIVDLKFSEPPNVNASIPTCFKDNVVNGLLFVDFPSSGAP